MQLALHYREPYDVAGLLAFLLPRAVAGVERVDVAARCVQRTLSLAGMSGCLTAQFKRPGAVEITLSPGLLPVADEIMPLLRRWLDLDADPQAIAAALGEEAATPGLRLPGCVDRFELAVRAVLGQQVTVAAARTVAGRFVARFGEPMDGAPVGANWLFPSAARMAGVGPERIAELGVFRRRADSMVALAQRWPELAFARMSGEPLAALAELCSLPGIGPWTAHYMLMRGWSWPDAFPPGDVILRQQLSRGQAALLSPKAYLAAAERYRPYRSYAVLQLWRAASASASAPALSLR